MKYCASLWMLGLIKWAMDAAYDLTLILNLSYVVCVWCGVCVFFCVKIFDDRFNWHPEACGFDTIMLGSISPWEVNEYFGNLQRCGQVCGCQPSNYVRYLQAQYEFRRSQAEKHSKQSQSQTAQLRNGNKRAAAAAAEAENEVQTEQDIFFSAPANQRIHDLLVQNDNSKPAHEYIPDFKWLKPLCGTTKQILGKES